MAHDIKRIARGNTAKVNSYTGPSGELVMDTQAKELVMQDGTTPGGIRIKSYGKVTTTADGLMAKEDKVKLDALHSYSDATPTTSGLLSSLDKKKLDSLQNYSLVTSTVNGLMSSADKIALTKLIEAAEDIINVKDLGAVGDGVTDNTTIFANALNNSNNPVYVPAGIYLVESVDMNRLYGEGIIRWKTGKQISLNNVATTHRVSQTFWGEAYNSYNGTVQDCSICYDSVAKKTYLFTCQQTGSGDKYTPAVKHVITQYEMPSTPVTAPNLMTLDTNSNIRPVARCVIEGKIGHGEGIYAICKNGQFYLYCQAVHQYDSNGNIIRRAATGFAKVTWKGNSTTSDDVSLYYGLNAIQNAGQVCLSPDGKYLIVCFSLDTYSTKPDGSYWRWDYSSANKIVMYDRAALENANNDAARENILPISSFVFGRRYGNVVRSGVATDDRFIYILSSGSTISAEETLTIYSYNGDVVKNIRFDGPGDTVLNYFKRGISSGGNLYFPYAKEIEGLALLNDSIFSVGKLHLAKLITNDDKVRYCTWLGRTYIAKSDNKGVLPSDADYWFPVDYEFSNALEWNAATQYTAITTESEILHHYRYIVGISPQGVYNPEYNLGQVKWNNPDIYDLVTSGNVLTLLSKDLSRVTLGSLSYNLGSMVPYTEFYPDGQILIFDSSYQMQHPSADIYSGRVLYSRSRDAVDYHGSTSIYGKTAFMRVGKIDDSHPSGGIAFFTGEGDTQARRLYIVPEQGTIRVYDDLRPASDDTSYLGNGNLYWKKAYLRALQVKDCIIAENLGTDETPDYTLHPLTDHVTLGRGGHYFSDLYVNTTHIGSSDLRLKTAINDIPENLMRAWSKVNFKIFKFIDSVNEKGIENARIHAGCIAQEINTVFSSEGLNASDYGFFCYDEWPNKYEDVEVVDQQEILDDQGNTIQSEKTHIERKLVEKAGNKFGLRYTECLILECAYQRWLGKIRDAKIAALGERLAALEALINK